MLFAISRELQRSSTVETQAQASGTGAQHNTST